MTRQTAFVAVLVASLSLAPGCSLIDGLTGSDPGGDSDGGLPPPGPDAANRCIDPMSGTPGPCTTCEQPLDLGVVSAGDSFDVIVPTCGQADFLDPFGPSCVMDGPGEELVLAVTLDSGSYDVCVTDPGGGRVLYADDCIGGEPIGIGCLDETIPCLTTGGPGPSRRFLIWQSLGPGSCGEVNIVITPNGDGFDASMPDGGPGMPDGGVMMPDGAVMVPDGGAP